MNTIAELNFESRPVDTPGTFASITFENGYMASIITGPLCATDTDADHPYEIAVIYGGGLVHDTPVTDDVCGHLNEDEANKVLAQIAALPPRYS